MCYNPNIFQFTGSFDGFRLVLIGDMHEQPMLHLRVKPFNVNVRDWTGEVRILLDALEPHLRRTAEGANDDCSADRLLESYQLALGASYAVSFGTEMHLTRVAVIDPWTFTASVRGLPSPSFTRLTFRRFRERIPCRMVDCMPAWPRANDWTST